MEVSRLDKSTDIKLEQPSNNLFIFLSKGVEIVPKFTFIKFEHPLNIDSMVVTLVASKLDKSISFILFKDLNMDAQVFISTLNFRVTLFNPSTKSHVLVQEFFSSPFTITIYGSMEN